MFQALHAYHQEAKLYRCSIWYRPLSQWPSGAQVERELLLLYSSTCFKHYMFIIRRLNYIDAASGIVLSVSGRPVHRLRENCRAVLSQPVHWTATD